MYKGAMPPAATRCTLRTLLRLPVRVVRTQWFATTAAFALPGLLGDDPGAVTLNGDVVDTFNDAHESIFAPVSAPSAKLVQQHNW